MSLDAEVLQCAKLSSYLQNTDTACEHIVELYNQPAEYVVDRTVIHLLDGIKSGQDAKAVVIESRSVADPELHQVTIVFRGSGIVSKELWVMNQNSMAETLRLQATPGSSSLNVLIHGGLLRMYNSLRADIQTILKNCPPRTRVTMTGFGTGGGLARIATLECGWMNYMNPYQVNFPFRVVTFATPSFSRSDFPNLLSQINIKGDNDIHLTGILDPVTRWNFSPRTVPWIIPPGGMMT